jgi:hypothetical protein
MSKRFTSRLRSPRLTSQVGLWLGVFFGICFVTGFISHAIQHPPSWFLWPSRPVGLYRITQGVHVATGLASIPLLAVKLWSVFPRLFKWPALRDPVKVIERVSVLVLVVASLFQVLTGILNIARWYSPMGFFFTVAHYWTAWAVIGALLVHLGVKLPIVRRALTAKVRPVPATGSLTRRGLLAAMGLSSGAIAVFTVGQTLRPFAGVSVLAPRDPRVGPQGVPVNTPAVAAGVTADATHPAYRLEVVGPARTLSLSLADLEAMHQYTSGLPITCVEGWSADATWTGVRLRDLVAAVGGDRDSQVTVTSLQQNSRYATSVVAPPHARDPLTLLALQLHGEPLDLDHGYPCRLIAPNRPGVLQTKWVRQVVVEAAA